MQLINYNDMSIAACECGHKRFKTIHKKYVWACRKCGQLRAYIKEKEDGGDNIVSNSHQ